MAECEESDWLTIAWVIGQLNYVALVSGVRFAGRSELSISVIQYLFRGVNLQGIYSVMQVTEPILFGQRLLRQNVR